MSDALRYEWFRLRSVRSTYWLIGITLTLVVGLGSLIAYGISTGQERLGRDDVYAIVATTGASTGVPPLLVAYLLGLLGVFSIGHEYRHGMIRATLTAIPSRPRVLAAKAVVVTAAVGVVAALSTLPGIAVLAAFGLDLPSVGAVGSLTAGVTIFTMLFTLSGIGLTALVRNQTAGLVLLLLLPTVAESVLRYVVVVIRLFSDDPTAPGGLPSLLKYLPYDAGGQMYTRFSLSDAGTFIGGAPFGPLGGGITLAVFVALVLAAGTARFLRRDA